MRSTSNVSVLSLPIFALSLAVACSSPDDASTEAASAGSTSSTSSTMSSTDAGSTAAPTTGASSGTTSGASMTGDTAPTSTGPDESSGGVVDTGDLSTGTTSSETGSTTSDETTEDTTGADAEVYDPNLDGPWTIAATKGTWKVGQVDVAMNGFYPTAGPEAGPYPVVVIAHGFQLPVSQYVGYAQRLATHGYVALTADYQAGLFNPDHVVYTKEVLGGIDWAAQEPMLAGVADTNNVGLTGHSLGGKLSVLGAAIDNRVRASITLDPVDGSMNCDQNKCPDASDKLPLGIPMGFVGETLDSMGFMACAPAADNFLTFYAKAAAPALAVTVLGANHMSFLDDVSKCGFNCSFCKAATLDNATVNALSRAYVVAFYGRYLKDNAGYDTYLTGALAQERYVDKKLVTLQSK